MSDVSSNKSPKNPVLSVVIPVTKMAGKLENLGSWLHSVNGYSIEVIIVHDVQDDRTAIELNSLLGAIRSDKILLFEGQFDSPGLARNEGIRHVNGTWIAFWDSDDIPILEKVFQSIEGALSEASTLICSFQVVSHETKQILWSAPRFKTTDNSAQISSFPGLWRMIFKNELIQGSKFREFKMAEDQLYLIENNLVNNDVIFTDAITYSYFVGFPNQLTSQKEKIADLADVISAIVKLQKRRWSKLDLRLIARITLTALTKGNLRVKNKTIWLLLRLMNTLGVKNFANLVVFQLQQILTAVLTNIKIGGGKVADALNIKR
jgi:hypothetical protein